MKTTAKIARVLGLASALAAMLACNISRAADKSYQVKDGDTIVFLGDSITAKALDGEFGFINIIKAELAKAMPEAKINVIGAGVNGNKTTDAQKRLDQDVLAHKPSLVFIFLGVNDVWFHTGKFGNRKGTSKEDYAAALKDLVARSKASGAHVVLCTPAIIGEKTDGTNEVTARGKPSVKTDKLLEEYVEISRKVASETGAQLVDLHKAFREKLKADNQMNLPKGNLTYDGVHLNADGNMLVAKLMLAAINIQYEY